MEKIGKYTTVSEIGGGNFGKVYKVVDEQGQFFAMKKIQTRGMNEKLRSLIENEKVVLQQINHSSVLKFVAFFESAHHVYIVTELCEGGDLENYLKINGKVEYEVGRRWIRDLTDALKTLKNQNILHRDLKVANLLITDKDFNKAEIKICDFGFSKFLDSSLTRTQLGTPLYMAPEIFTSPAYNYKVDIWSLGVVSYEILCGNPPFKCYNLDELKRQQKNQISFEDNPSLPEPAKDFIRQLLTYNPEQRPDYLVLLDHEFLKFEDEIKVEKNEIDETEYDMLDDLSEKQEEEDIEKPAEGLKSEENFKESPVELEEIVDAAGEEDQKFEENKNEVKIEENEVKKKENKNEDKIEENKQGEIKINENPLVNQSIIVYLQKELQNFAMGIEKEIETLKIYEKLATEYQSNPEMKYFLTEYRHKKVIELFQKIEEVKSNQSDVEELERLLEDSFSNLQINGFKLQEEIEKSRSTYNFQESYIRESIINEGYDLIENPNSLAKVKLIFEAAFYIYPGDEIIFGFLSEQSS